MTSFKKYFIYLFTYVAASGLSWGMWEIQGGGDTPGPPPFLLPTVLQCNLKILYTQALGRILAVLRSSGAGRGGWGVVLTSLPCEFIKEFSS